MKHTAPATCPTCGHTERVDLDEDGEAHMDTNPCVRCDKPLCAECQRSVPGVGLVCEGCRDLDEFAGVSLDSDRPVVRWRSKPPRERFPGDDSQFVESGSNGSHGQTDIDTMRSRFNSGTPASELRANWR